MIYLFIFILLLSIYEIYYIIKNANDIKIPLIILYSSITFVVILLGVYYNYNKYDNSIAYYILKILKISY